MTNAYERQKDRYRQIARDVVSARPNNRVRKQCLGELSLYGSHSPTDFETDLGDYFFAAAEAGLIKIVHRGQEGI